MAVAVGTLQRSIFPPQGMDVALIVFGTEALVDKESIGMVKNLLDHKISSERMRRLSPMYQAFILLQTARN
jgi:hypothetical protein